MRKLDRNGGAPRGSAPNRRGGTLQRSEAKRAEARASCSRHAIGVTRLRGGTK